MTLNRRTFVSAATATAASYNRVLGANEKIRVGLIGSGGQGRSDWKLFLKHPDVTPVAVADVYEPNLEQGLSLANGQAKGYRDFRKLIERKDIDVVIVGTPRPLARFAHDHGL